MSRAILAGLVALLGLSTGAAFATNDFLAGQAATQAAFLGGSTKLAAEGGSGGSAGNTSQGSSSAGPSSSRSSGAGSQGRPGGMGNTGNTNSGKTGGSTTGGGGGGTGDPDKTGTGPGSTRGGDKDPGARSPSNPGAGGDPTGKDSTPGGQGTNPGNTPGAGGGCSGGGGCDSGAQQAQRDKEAAAQKAAERTQNYANDLQNYNRDRQSSPADIKAAKEAAEARLSTTRSISPSVPAKTPTTPAPKSSYFSDIPSYNPATPREAALADLNATLAANREAVANAQKESTDLQARLDAFNKANPEGLASQQPSEVDPKTANAIKADAARVAAEKAAAQRKSDLANYGQAQADMRAQQAAKAAADARIAAMSRGPGLSDPTRANTAVNNALNDARAADAANPSALQSAWNSLKSMVGLGQETEIAENTPVKNNVTEIAKTPGEVVQSVSPAERALMNPSMVNPNQTTFAKTSVPNEAEENLTEAAAKEAGYTEPGVEDPGTACAACGPDYDKELAKGVVRSSEFFGDPKTMKTPVNQAESNRIAAQQHANFDREVAEAEAAGAKTTISPAGGVVSPAKATITGRSDVGYNVSGYADPAAPGRTPSVSRSVPSTQQSAQASAQGLGGFGNYQQNAGTNPSQQARAETSAQGLGGFGNYQQNAGTAPRDAAEAQARADAQQRAETSAQGLGGFGNYQNNVGTEPSERAAAEKAAAEARARAEASAQGLGGFGNYQQNAGTAPSDQARAQASAQGLGGFGNYQTNLGTAPNQSVKSADSGLVETAPGKGDLQTEQSLAQKIGGWVKDAFTGTEPMPKADQIAQKTTVPVAGTVTVNGVKVSVKAERNIETGELSTPIGGVVGDNTPVSAPDGIQTVKTEKGTVVDVKVQGGRVVGISGTERADVAQGLGGFGNYQQNAGTAPSEQARAEASAQGLGGYGNYQQNVGTAPGDKAAAQARADAQARAEVSAQGLGGFGNYQQNAGTEPSERVAAENAAKAAQDARIAAMSRGPGLSSPEQAENAFNNALADAKAADAERAAAQPSAVSKIATTIGDTWTGLKDSLAGMFGTTPTKQITERLPGGEETTNVENGVLSYSDNDPSGIPTGIGSVATQNDVVPDNSAQTAEPAAQTPRVGQSIFESQNPADMALTGRAPAIQNRTLNLQNGTVAARMTFDAVNGRFSLNTAGEQPKTNIPDGVRSYAVDGVRVNVQFRDGKAVGLAQAALPGTVKVTPAADKEYDQQAVNGALYDGLPEAVVPGVKTPVKTVNPKKDEEADEVVVSIEKVPDDVDEIPPPAEKKKSVIDTIRDLLPGGNPPKQPRDEGGGSDRPWWVKEQSRKDPVATTTSETYDRSWMEALRARLGW